MQKTLPAAALLLLAAQAAIADPAGADPAGFRAVSIPSEDRGRDLEGAVFYPAAGGGRAFLFGDNPVFRGVEVLEGARPAGGPLPIVLVSHGLGGSHRSLGWLPAGLARKGALALSVNHSGRDFDLREGVKHWTRAQDFRAALDWLAGEAELSPLADFSRVYAAGFSLGGWTALSLGGLRADLEGYIDRCRAIPPSSMDCADLARRGVDLRSYAAEDWNASRKDDRVRAVVAIDPPFTYGLGAAQARALVGKVLLIGLGSAETRLPVTDFSETGSGFAARLPGAEIEILAPAAHFSALLPCKPAGKALLALENEDPVCDDPPGADRAALHRRTIARIAQFLGL